MIKKSPEISFDGRSELVVAPIVEDPNCRKIGNYSFNVRFCLGEGSYGLFYILASELTLILFYFIF
jgi:hypothetical protein